MYPIWINFVGFQAIWFAAILGREHMVWACAVLLLAHLWACKAQWVAELKLLGAAAAIGLIADGTLTFSGVFSFDPAPAFLPIPLWLVLIWMALAATFRHSMAYLIKRPVLMTVLAGVAAPLSYLAGQRLGAVAFEFSQLVTAAIVAGVWFVVTPLCITLTRYVNDQASAGIEQAAFDSSGTN